MNPDVTAPALERLDSEQIDHLLEAIAGYERAMRTRGLDYLGRGRVGPIAMAPGLFGAQVRGTQVYTCWWRYDDFDWQGECSCPVTFECKHLYAVAAALLQPIRETAPFAMRGLLPRERVRWARLGLPELDGLAEVDEDTDDDGPPSYRRVPLPPDDELRRRGLALIRDGVTHTKRHDGFGLLLAGLRDQLALDGQVESDEALREQDPDLRVWRVLQAITRCITEPLPADLQQVLDDPRLTARIREASARDVRVRLRKWMAAPVANARSLRFLLRVTPGQNGAANAALEARLTSARLRDARRDDAQLVQLLNEANRDGSALDPRSVQVLRAYLGTTAAWTPWRPPTALDTAKLRAVLEASSGSDALVWDPACDATLASRHALPLAAPIQMSGAILRVAPTLVARADQRELTLALAWPDGTTRPVSDALLLLADASAAGPALAVVDGQVHLVLDLPPDAIMEGFRQAGSIALDAAEDAPLVRSLAARFESVERAVRAQAKVYRAEPVFVMALDERDQLRVRLFATTRAGVWQPFEPPANDERVFELCGPGDWRVSDGGTHEAGSGSEPTPLWFEELSRDDVAPAERWLALTGAEPSERFVNGETPRGFWLPMYGPALDRLASALKDKPTHARWFATPELQRVLAAPVTVSAKVSTRPSGVDLLAIAAEWEADGAALSAADMESLRSSRSALVKLSSGWVVRSEDDQIAQLETALADLGVEAGAGETAVTMWQLAQASPGTWDLLAGEAAAPELRAAVEHLRAEVAAFKGIPKQPVPRGFKGKLRPYQREGVDFLAWTSALGMGAVLADDMGLGKTVQTLVWLLHLRQHDPSLGPALVVAPASVMHNWRREAERFAPGLRVAVLESGSARRDLLANANAHDLLVTNYALLRRDIETWREIELGAAVLDEAQNIKNPVAAISQAARELRARHRLALTGTPLENRALDLWSIMAFVNPGLLGTQKQFRSRYERADAPPFVRRLLAARVRPVFMRRLKSEVARDLPERIEERLDCDLQPLQRKLYLAEVREARDMIAAMSMDAQGLQRGQIAILAKLTRLRQICCHPALTGASDATGSGKFDAFWELIEALHDQGEKVLVFSQFVQCLERLRAGLIHRGISNHMLTGASRKRDELVAAFQDEPGPGVFLISLKAGGTGLNLTSARNVVLFDPWWNPAVEAQAIDRAHRIGQTRTVIAHRLIARGTIEERILELQAKKADLADAILGEGGAGQALSREDLDYLLAPQ